MFSFTPSMSLFLTLSIIILLASPTYAFGAGNIASVSKIEGVNWRHGDIEDTLLTLIMSRAAGGKKFGKMDVARVYFGNWLRDYSQAIDVGTVKYVSAEAIRILLWVLGFMTFGYGTREFEVTSERLGCYRPEDHIDNPKDYADNIDARQYDTRLRGPVNERVELAIDEETGMKNYIANENVNIVTSAGHVRKLFTKSIELGRRYARNHNKDDLYESLRLLGTGCHCLEDFSAHSNYTELALIEMGERDVFPHVGRDTKMRLQGARNGVYPIITGTFGGVDFLHSVMGEFDDKATQSEIAELEGTLQEGGKGDTSFLKELLDKLPSGLLGGDQSSKADELQANATAAQMQNMRITPKEPEAFTMQMQEVVKQIYPIMEWHDNLFQQINKAIDEIPVLPDLIEQFTEQMNIFVFSLLAPLVVPIINQLKNELNTGSSEVIQSSLEKQHVVFNDDRSTDPTHSMISKDHFSNILNEPAGKIASQVLKWTVPQIIRCMDNEREDSDRVINRIIHGVFHHPAQRQMGDDGAQEIRGLMFQVVEQWWGEKDSREQADFRDKLSRDGVEQGRNHKEGVHDGGHGSCKPLGMKNNIAGPNSGAAMLMGGLQNAISNNQSSGGNSNSNQFSKFAEEAAGGGALGSIVGGLAGALGGSLLSGFDKKNKDEYESSGYTQDGGYRQSHTEIGRQGNQYGQAEYSQTQEPDGSRVTDYQRYSQNNTQSYGYEAREELKPSYGGGYEQKETRVYERPDGETRESWTEGETADGRHYHEAKHHKKTEEYEEEKPRHHGKHHKKRHSDSSEEYKPDNEDREQMGRVGAHEYGFREEPTEPQRVGGGYGQQYGGQQYGGPPPGEYGGGYGGQNQGQGYGGPPGEYGGGYGGQGQGQGYGGPPPGEYGGGGYGGQGQGYGGPPPGEYGGRGGYGGREEEEEEEYRERRDERGERRGGGWGGY